MQARCCVVACPVNVVPADIAAKHCLPWTTAGVAARRVPEVDELEARTADRGATGSPHPKPQQHGTNTQTHLRRSALNVTGHCSLCSPPLTSTGMAAWRTVAAATSFWFPMAGLSPAACNNTLSGAFFKHLGRCRHVARRGVETLYWC